jgi:tRNA A-37 threonylcarbamoyl transferase component Bud32
MPLISRDRTALNLEGTSDIPRLCALCHGRGGPKFDVSGVALEYAPDYFGRITTLSCRGRGKAWADLTHADFASLGNVVTIADDFFAGSPHLCHVKLPPRATVVGERFLAQCPGLAAVDLSALAGVLTLKAGFLEGNENLAQVTLPQRAAFTGVDDRFCAECPQLRVISLASFISVQAIGASFLAHCKLLSVVDLAPLAKLAVIGPSFLEGCSALTALNVQPLGAITNIPDNFCAACTGLTTLDLTGLRRVLRIGPGFLRGCIGLHSVLLPAATPIESIGDNFLFGCTALRQIDLRPLWNISTIPNYFLSDCHNITAVDLTPFIHVTRVGSHFLSRLHALTSVDLAPLAAVTDVGSDFMAGTNVRAVDLNPLKNVTCIGSGFLANTPVPVLDVTPLTGVKQCGSKLGEAVQTVVVKRGNANAADCVASAVSGTARCVSVVEPQYLVPQAHWVPDTDQDACTICHTTFTQINRRHHCRPCGGLVCNACSLSRVRCIDDNEVQFEAQRCCDACAVRHLTPPLTLPVRAGVTAIVDNGVLRFVDPVTDDVIGAPVALTNPCSCLTVSADGQLLICVLRSNRLMKYATPFSRRAFVEDQAATRQRVHDRYLGLRDGLTAEEDQARTQLLQDKASENAALTQWLSARLQHRRDVGDQHVTQHQRTSTLEDGERATLLEKQQRENVALAAWIGQREALRQAIVQECVGSRSPVEGAEIAAREELLKEARFDRDVVKRLQQRREAGEAPSVAIPKLVPARPGSIIRIHERNVVYNQASSLGNGATAVVYAATVKGQRQPCAFKRFYDHVDRSAIRELSILAKLSDCSAFIPMLAAVHANTDDAFSGPVVGIIMELMQGDYATYLHKRRGRLAPSDILQQLGVIAYGLDVAHSRGIVHADLKPQNILVSRFGQVFISDCGSAHQMFMTAAHMSHAPSALTATRGTTLFTAPEVALDYAALTPKCDVFSFGMTVWYCFHPDVETPLGPGVVSDFQVNMALIQGKRPPIDSRVPAGARALMERCWAGKPEERPSMHEVMVECDRLVAESVTAEGEAVAAQAAALNSWQQAAEVAERAAADAKSLAEQAEAARTHAAQAMQAAKAAEQMAAELAWRNAADAADARKAADEANARARAEQDAATKAKQQALSATASATEAQRMLAMVDKNGLAGVALKGAFSFMCKPVVSAADAVRQCRFPKLTPAQLSTVAAAAEKTAVGVAKKKAGLTHDEATALAAYTYELGTGTAKINFYAQLNDALVDRAHSGRELAELEPYLFYICNALTKLPALPPGTLVYRGVDAESKPEIERRYALGSAVYWSPFTSTSPDVRAPKAFAGSGGVLFKIGTLTGRAIRDYSCIPGEEEVLLAANTMFTVTRAMYFDPTLHIHCIDLLEQKHGEATVR